MRWVIRATLALVLALGAGLAGLLLLPQERIARIAADQLEAQTGRRVGIAPPLSISLWPVLGVDTGPVTLANAPGAGPEPMLEAEGLSIGLSAPDLLRGAFRVTHVVARAPVLRLSEDASGRGNWDISAAAAAPAASPAPQGAEQPAALPALERLELTGARLIYAAPGADPLDLSGVDLVFDWPDPSGVANIALSLPWRGTPLKIAATSPDLPALLQGAVARVTAEVTAPGGSLRFAGRASTSGAAAGQITLDAADTARLMASAGLDAPSIPPGLGRRAALRADLTYTPDGRLALRDLDMTLDGNRLRGAADVTLSGKPVFNARLTAGALDLRGAMPTAPSPTSGPARAPAPGWSDAPIDAAALAFADGALALTATSISLPQTDLGRTDLLLTLDRARAVLSLTRVEAFGGQVTGELVANNRNGLSVGGKLTVAEVSAERLLGDLAGTTRLSGQASGDLQFLGVGQTEAQIMASLSGRGGLSMGQGRLAGFDLDALMAGDKSLRGTTVFDRLSASFTIEGGTLRNDDLALSLPNFRVDGAGRVGLGARDIDYLLTPTALRPRGGQGLALPIRIKGPWANPKIRPEIDEIFKAKADAKIEAVRAEAKEQVRQKLSEELETPISDEDTLKDAVKSRLKDKARDRLLNFLDQN